jgi:hypothetical protein
MVRSRFPPDRVQQPSVERGLFTAGSGRRKSAARRVYLAEAERAAGLSLVICVALGAGALLDWLTGHSQVAAELALQRLLEDVASSAAYFPRLKLGIR